MEQALRNIPVMEPSAPEGLTNTGGEWFYNEYVKGAGISSVGLDDHVKGPAGAELQALPAADEKKKILDLFKN
jgi:penicillin-binding protein 1A